MGWTVSLPASVKSAVHSILPCATSRRKQGSHRQFGGTPRIQHAMARAEVHTELSSAGYRTHRRSETAKKRPLCAPEPFVFICQNPTSCCDLAERRQDGGQLRQGQEGGPEAGPEGRPQPGAAFATREEIQELHVLDCSMCLPLLSDCGVLDELSGCTPLRGL